MIGGLWLMIAAFAALAVAFRLFERSKSSSKEISLIACMAAIAAVGRVPFAAVPGLQPATFVVIVTGFSIGPSAGFLTGAVAALASNLFLGEGPWTVWQMLAWGLCGCCSGLLGIVSPRAGRLVLCVFALVWGYLFGWIVNFWFWHSFVSPLSLSTWLAVNASSLPFDTLHAVGNVFFMAVLGPPFIRALRYFRKRLVISYELQTF